MNCIEYPETIIENKWTSLKKSIEPKPISVMQYARQDGFGQLPVSYFKALPNLSASACKAASIICSHMPNDWSQDCYCTYGHVKSVFNMSRPTWSKAIKELVDNKIIRIAKRIYNGEETNYFQWIE